MPGTISTLLDKYSTYFPVAPSSSLQTQTKAILFASAVALIPVLKWLYSDYKQWMSLTPGAWKKTFLNWVLSVIIRPFNNNTRATSVYIDDGISYLPATLPIRKGTRPGVNSQPIPQRQLDQVPVEMEVKLRKVIEDIYLKHLDILEKKESVLEKCDKAYFIRRDVPRPNPNLVAELKGEICHIHPQNCTLHVTLSQTDAKKVLESGWGERHPWSGGKMKPFHFPLGYTLIYAPRNDEELELARKFFIASISYITGKNVTEGAGISAH